MNFENYEFLMSVWGAGLSSILAILAIVKFRRESRTTLLVLGVVEKPFTQLRVEICNKRAKPASIKEIKIGIGTSKDYQKELVKIKYDRPPKLAESDIFIENFDRKVLMESLKKNNIDQMYFQRLWISVIVTTGEKMKEPTYIEPSIIAGDYYIKAQQFIATDLFLGFERMNSQVYPIGIK
jgi:hypothetical protein